MSSPDGVTRTAPTSGSAPVVDVAQAEAALVEHYPRLVRLGYLVLPPSLGRNRRVLTAHALTQRALPRGRAEAPERAPVPAPRMAAPRAAAGYDGDPGYRYVRLRVLRSALEAGLPLRRTRWPKRAQLPPLLPQVWGLRLFPRSGGADELALDQRLAALSGPARAAYVLRGLERLPDTDVRKVLEAAGVADPHAALAEADGAPVAYGLLASPEFDPCALQARPTDLLRRRRHGRAALVAAAGALVCGTLLALPGGGLGPDGTKTPAATGNPAAEAALDPGLLTKAAARDWRSATRTDFSVWPARGALTGDQDLLRRALAVWARPGGAVRVSATPGTPSGGPPGPAQLLYAGRVGDARVVILYDGWRLVRYAEPQDGAGGAALDFARVDGADAAVSGAVVVDRTARGVRYLTAPWVRAAAVRDLRDPVARARPLRRAADGVTAPLATPAPAKDCTSVPALELRGDGGTRLLADLGELTPAHLTAGRPQAPGEVSGRAARASWAGTACLLPEVRSHGVRSVNSWAYASQSLPGGDGTATWVCTRAETWRGPGSRVLAQFQALGERTGVVAAKAQDSPACGAREPRVLAGVLWKSRAGGWHVLAAGSAQVVSVGASGGATGSARGNVLAVPAHDGARAELTGRLADGTPVRALR